MTETEKPHGGYILVARKLFTSELWMSKPNEWLRAWLYILQRVNYAKDMPVAGLPAGTARIIFDAHQQYLQISRHQWNRCLAYLAENGSIERAGSEISVCNWEAYQDPTVYRTAPAPAETVILPASAEQLALDIAAPKEPRRETWLSACNALWEKYRGGRFPWGVGGKFLKPLHEKHGDVLLLQALENHLKRDGNYCSLSRFVSNFGTYLPRQDIVDATSERVW